MYYIYGTKIFKNKPVFIALTQIFGINISTAKIICNALGIGKLYRLNQLKQNQINFINSYISYNYLTKFTLKKVISEQINFLINIMNYKGSRHKKGLPVNGQRTRSNAKTQKRLAMSRLLKKKKKYDNKFKRNIKKT